MKKQISRFTFFMLLLTTFCAYASAQNVPAKAARAAKKLAQTVPVARGAAPVRPAYVRLGGNLRLDPDRMLPGDEGRIVQLHAYFRSPQPNGEEITSALTKRWLAKHREILYQEKMRYLGKVALLKKDRETLPDVLKDIVLRDRVPYAELIPPQTRVLYLGEAHYQTNIPAEIKRVISDMRRARPERDIIVMSEFWPDYVNLYGAARTRLPRNSVAYGRDVLDFVRRKGLTAFGLEDMTMLYKTAHMQGVKKNEFASTFVGMEKRNRYWARQIKDALRVNKDALVIVYAGAAHVNWAFRMNVPELVGEPESFVLQFGVPEMDQAINPIFQYMYVSDETKELFEMIPTSKIFMSLFDKKYRPLIGYDAAVTVHAVAGDRGLAAAGE